MVANTFSVTSWNIQRGYAITTQYPRWGLNLDAVAAKINADDLGLIGLQEAEATYPISGLRDIAHYLATATSLHYYYGLNPLGSSFQGSPILSPYPLYGCSAHPLVADSILPSFAYTECHVRLSDSKNLTMINAHPPFTPKDVKRKHLGMVLDRALIAKRSGPVVITGDLNTKPWEEDLQPLLAEFSYQFGNTTMFPDGFPSATRPPSKSKVDYIFYSGLKLLSARILEETWELSDHKAVNAKFVWL